jgi:outer membrane lipoprotein-sorting protein
MMRRSVVFIFLFILLGLFLSGCPKKVPPPTILEKPSAENPVEQILEILSSTESLQSRISIRIHTVRSGEEMNFLLNGFLLYQKPDKLRILGYHPLGASLFDALYREKEFFLLLPLQRKAFTGEISEFDDLMEKAGPIEVLWERREGSEIPALIRIDFVEKKTRIDLRLKEVETNSSLPEDSFLWVVPEGVEVTSISRLLRGKILK